MTEARQDLAGILQHVRARPDMWVRGRSLDELQLLIRGYGIALGIHRVEELGTTFCRDFGDYLANRFGWSLACGWAVAIRTHSRAKDRGWSRFFQLFDDFMASRSV